MGGAKEEEEGEKKVRMICVRTSFRFPGKTDGGKRKEKRNRKMGGGSRRTLFSPSPYPSSSHSWTCSRKNSGAFPPPPPLPLSLLATTFSLFSPTQKSRVEKCCFSSAWIPPLHPCCLRGSAQHLLFRNSTCLSHMHERGKGKEEAKAALRIFNFLLLSHLSCFPS